MKNGNARAIIAGIAACALSHDTWAAGSRSNTPEIFFQPPAGGMAASVETFFLTSPMQESYSSQGTPVYTHETGRTAYGARFAYAITEAWAAHIFTSTEARTIKIADQYGAIVEKADGLGDVELKLTNLTALGSWSLHVALGATLSPDKHTEPTQTKDGNINSGGNGIVNALGLSTPIGSGVLWGLKLGYVTNLEKTANSNVNAAADYKIAGGNQTLTRMFFELDFAEFESDLTVGYDFFDPIVKIYADGSQATNDAYSALVVGVGAQVQFLGFLNLRASLESTTYGTRNYPTLGTQTSTYAQSLASVRLRYEF